MADRRVRRTRGAIRAAMLSLMAERGYESVTVQDVIDRADVGRSTFYSHYQDKTDLLAEMMGELRVMIGADPVGGEPLRRRPLRFSGRLLDHVRDQPALLRALLGRGGGGQVLVEIEGILRDLVKAELEALIAVSSPPRVPLELIVGSAVATFVATLAWWVGEDLATTPDRVDALYLTLVGPGIRAAIPPPGDPLSGPPSDPARRS